MGILKGLTLTLATIPFWGLLVIIGIAIFVLFGAGWFLTVNLAKIVGLLLIWWSVGKKDKKLEGTNLVLFILGLVLIFNPFHIVDKILPMAMVPLN